MANQLTVNQTHVVRPSEVQGQRVTDETNNDR